MCPAPNAYGVPPIKDSPAYSLAARAKEPKTAIVPGPGTYEVCDLSHFKFSFRAVRMFDIAAM